MIKNLLSIFISLVLFFKVSSQTVVIAKKTKKAIYVGADSRMLSTVYYDNGRIQIDTTSGCKIHSYGKFNFAIIGTMIDVSLKEAAEACKIGKTFDEVMQLYAKSFLQKLADHYEKIRKNYFDIFTKLVEKNQPNFTQIIFFGAEGDSLFLAHLYSRLTSSPSESVTFTMYKLMGNILAAGHVGEITDTLKKKNLWDNGIFKTIDYLIKEEMKYHPLEVGGAIDLIRITKRKTKWIRRKSMCEL